MGERIMKTPESDIPLANAAAAISNELLPMRLMPMPIFTGGP